MTIHTAPEASATIVGGGPAGLMAAEVLATAGWVVTVYEHMPSVGRKLLLAGRSGLNLTHAGPIADLLAHYAETTVVQAAVRAFDADSLRAWSAGLGESTFVGSSGRVFPRSTKATPLLRAWLARLTDLGVRIEVRHKWLGWSHTGGCRFQRIDGTVVEVTADATVFALGGASWPHVGADGGWVAAFRAAGVTVYPLRPANCGVRIPWSTVFGDRFAGTPLKNIALRVAGSSVRGDATITTDGLESGPVYPLSAAIRDEIERAGCCTVLVDLHPDLTEEAIARRMAHRRPKESLATWLRRSLGLGPAAVGLLRESTGNEIVTDPTELARLLKSVPLTVRAVMPIERAISSAGGIALDEVDEHCMLHRLPGVFVAGEMLDWEAPTGGYLLQATFSTAVLAAKGAIERQQAIVAECRPE
ncbi:MAG: TIGR03862 family flavoprotein [Actinomycetota bacterium]